MAFGDIQINEYWNANTNSPKLVSGKGRNGQGYLVSVAGSTALDGISTWNVDDVVVFLLDQWVRVAGPNSIGGGGGGGGVSPAGSDGDLQIKSGTALAAISRAGGNATDYLGRDNTYKVIPTGGGGGGTTVTGGGLGFNFDSRAAAVSTTIASVASGGPNWIRTNGYATAGDGGGALYVRVGSAPAYSNLIWFQSADGQYWGIAYKNEPLRLEQAGGGVSASAAANSAAVDALHSIFYTNKVGFGYGYAGPTIVLGVGTYNLAGPWFIKGATNIRGLGSGWFGGYPSEVKFPVNSDGFVVGDGQTNGRFYNPSIYSNFDGRGSVIRDLKITGGWDGSAVTYAQNQSTGQRGHGLLLKGGVKLENLYINRFAEIGVNTKGTIGGGGSGSEPTIGTADNTDPSESYVCVQGSVNNFCYIQVAVEVMGSDGFRDRGADANAGTYIACSSGNNGGWGFNSMCFLGNWFWGCHSTTNGIRGLSDPNSGKNPGSYQMLDPSCFGMLVACYSEGGQAGLYMKGFSMVIGGIGLTSQTGSSHTNYFHTGDGAYFSPFFTPTLGGNVAVGQANVDGEMMNFNGNIFVRNEFGRLDTGTFGIPNSYSVTVSGFLQTMGRASSIGSGKFLIENGYWLGSGGSESDGRYRGVSNGLPTSGQFAQGDHIDIRDPSAGGVWGYVCTTGGDYAGTPPVWKSKGNLAA